MKHLSAQFAVAVSLLSFAVPASAVAEPPAAPTDVAAAPDGAARTASGVPYRVVVPGRGRSAVADSDLVVVHYTAWKTDGTLIDSTLTRNAEGRFLLRRTIPGWREGLLGMVAGETRRLWIPAELATMPGQPVQIDGTVVYDVQLVRIEREPQTPEDLTAPPSEAKRSGPSLASLVLIEGWGDENPTDGDRLLIHYSKWKPNGTLVRSTISRGKPESFEFDELEPAWVVPLSSMVEGEQRRIWISSAATAKEGPRVREIVEIELLRLQ